MTTPTTPTPACLGCARLEQPDCNTVVLLTGEVVCTWCQSWLAETRDREIEARATLAMSDRATRQAHLARLEARHGIDDPTHGAEYRRRLEASILGLWERRKATQAASSGDSDV